MKKIHLYILPVFFFGLILFFFFNQIVQVVTFPKPNENRNFATMPKLQGNRLDAFPKEYDEYLNDNFTFRVPFLNAYHELKYLMHISPNPDKALIGSDGHLFLAMRDQDIYNGSRYFERPQLDSMTTAWKARKTYLEEKKVSVYWLVGPIKHHVYAENLPMNVVERKGNRTLKLQKHFASEFPNLMLYPLEEFRREKGKEQLFFKLDNHWNLKGGYLAYAELMKRIRKDFPELQAIRKEDMHWTKSLEYKGGLCNFIGKDGELGEYIPDVKFPGSGVVPMPSLGFPCTKNFAYPDQYEKGFTNPKAKNKKRVLIIRDSFGDALIPFINETFSETLFIFDSWNYSINKQIMDTYKPDLVIVITMESLMDSMLDHPPIIDKEPV